MGALVSVDFSCGKDTGKDDGAYIKWHTIKDLKESVAMDVRRIKEHNLTPNDIPVHGYIYECESGKMVPVPM